MQDKKLKLSYPRLIVAMVSIFSILLFCLYSLLKERPAEATLDSGYLDYRYTLEELDYLESSSDIVQDMIDINYSMKRLIDKLHESPHLVDDGEWVYQSSVLMDNIFEGSIDFNNLKLPSSFEEAKDYHYFIEKGFGYFISIVDNHILLLETSDPDVILDDLSNGAYYFNKAKNYLVD